MATYDLIDPETGLVVGQVRDDGLVASADTAVRERVAHAFAREVMVRDGEVVEDLGICFLDVQTLQPGEPGHAALVLRNLAWLAGYLPRPQERDA